MPTNSKQRPGEPCHSSGHDQFAVGVGRSSIAGCVTGGPEGDASLGAGDGCWAAALPAGAPPAANTLRVPSGATSAAAGVTASSGSSVQAPASTAAAGAAGLAGAATVTGAAGRAGGLDPRLRGNAGAGAVTTAGGVGPPSGTPARAMRRTVAGRGGGGTGTKGAISAARACAWAARASAIDALAYRRSAIRLAARSARGGRAAAAGGEKIVAATTAAAHVPSQGRRALMLCSPSGCGRWRSGGRRATAAIAVFPALCLQ
jgi:hypothetical protein